MLNKQRAFECISCNFEMHNMYFKAVITRIRKHWVKVNIFISLGYFEATTRDVQNCMAGIMEKLKNLEQMIKYSHDMKIGEVRTKNLKI